MKKILSISIFCLLGSVSVAQVNPLISDTVKEPLNSLNSIIATASDKKVTLGAYAQIDYNLPVGDTVRRTGNFDIHRLVTFMGYKFSDRAHFATEIEMEHVTEVYVEQAFLNYRVRDFAHFRAGLLLIPMGIINEYHEPPTYNGVERPNIDGKIVPTTWREMGAGFTGKFDRLSLKYQLYVVNGFNGYDGTNGKFRGTDAYRKGRQKAAESFISSPNLSTKIDYYGITGLKLGGAVYYGKSQSMAFNGLSRNATLEQQASADSTVITALMTGLDARFNFKAFEARGQFIYAKNDNTEQYNTKTGKDLGAALLGYYLEIGYNLLKKKHTKQRLVPFVRYEKYDTHNKVTGEIARNKAYDRTDITTGLGWWVAPGAVFKADFQQFLNAADDNAKNQVNFGVGIWF